MYLENLHTILHSVGPTSKSEKLEVDYRLQATGGFVSTQLKVQCKIIFVN